MATPRPPACRACLRLWVCLLVMSLIVGWQLANIAERVDRAERLALTTSCTVLRKLHWDDPTRPDCAALDAGQE